ncbi:MAG: SDR family oxidoreductase [Acidimicrobiales bacterium]|nr:SDR family oxidoreductase [Acidimicrobiales bacterium]
MGRLDGKVAIVTGAGRGMGEAEAQLFAAEGARVVVADVLDDAGAAVAAAIGAAALYVHHDVTDEAAWHSLLALTRERFGDPDVLVTNAGVLHVAPLVETDVADLRRVLDVNLVGPFLGMKVIGGAMAAAGRGAIVNVSSTGGMVGMSLISAYVASKWALRGMTKSAAIELGRRGVRVNSLHPGGVATAMAGAAASVLTEPPPPGGTDPDPVLAALDARSGGQPIPRTGRPIEIARLALFLASDESSYCTGMEFVADGGDTAGRDLAGAF